MDGIKVNKIELTEAECRELFGIYSPNTWPVLFNAAANNSTVYYNTEVKKIIIPYGVTEIGAAAFCNMENLEIVEIPDTVTKIGDYAFSGCKNLTKLKCNKSIILTGILAFHNCILLPRVDGKIYGNLPDKSFLNCMSLAEFSFYDKGTTMGQGCFEDCVNLTRLYIYQDLELTDAFLEEHKEAEFFCGDKSKYLSLIHFGYKVMMFNT